MKQKKFQWRARLKSKERTPEISYQSENQHCETSRNVSYVCIFHEN